MRNSYLSLIDYEAALEAQAAAIAREEPTLFGFEARAVVTLGRRASAEELLAPLEDYQILKVDRGGQATIHNPGQLVIFPALPVRGVRVFINELAAATVRCLGTFGVHGQWEDTRPGVFTANGKIMACGLRIKNGWSTHGIAINVRNDLAPFRKIRACGIRAAAVDRVGGDVAPSAVFARWCEIYAEIKKRGPRAAPQVNEILS